MTQKLKEHYVERFKALVLEKEIRFTNFTPCQRSLNRKREIQIIKVELERRLLDICVKYKESFWRLL